MNCHFVVGQKVVCVDARWIRPSPPPLSLGHVYTVSWVGFCGGKTPDGVITFGTCLKLTEAENPDDDNPNIIHRLGYGFGAYRFRPVITRKTDISIFIDMLIEQKQQVQA